MEVEGSDEALSAALGQVVSGLFGKAFFLLDQGIASKLISMY